MSRTKQLLQPCVRETCLKPNCHHVNAHISFNVDHRSQMAYLSAYPIIKLRIFGHGYQSFKSFVRTKPYFANPSSDREGLNSSEICRSRMTMVPILSAKGTQAVTCLWWKLERSFARIDTLEIWVNPKRCVQNSCCSRCKMFCVLHHYSACSNYNSQDYCG